MLSDLWKRAAEAAIAAIELVVATMLSGELARMIRDADPNRRSEPDQES